MAYCNACGFQYSLGPTVCARCGAELPSVDRSAMDPALRERKDVRLKRFFAGLIDFSIAFGVFAVLFFGRRLVLAIVLRRSVAILTPHGYLLLKDAIEGKSVGKLLLGLVAYNTQEKKAVGLLDSIIRNWYLAIPFLGPTLLAVVIGAQILSGKQKRMGDNAAGTIVISDFEYQQLR